jgi:hypothetical protein
MEQTSCERLQPFSPGAETRLELIRAEETHYSKVLMCRALGLSCARHHAYSNPGPSRRALEEQQLDVLLAAIFAELGGRYGAPRSGGCAGW